MHSCGPIHIDYDHQIFWLQSYGGISRYFIEIASRISNSPEVEVRVIAPVHRNRLLAKNRSIRKFGFHLAHLIPKTATILNYINWKLARRILENSVPDIVHETYYSKIRLAPRSSKVVVTVHDLIHEKFPQFFSPSEAAATYEAKRASLERANHIICVSECTKNDLLQIYSINPSRITVIHHGCSIYLPQVSRTQVPRWGIPYVLYVGERGRYKNFLRLCEAFAKYQLYRSHTLICFGGGPFSQLEINAMRQFGLLESNVHVIEGDDAILAQCYAGADLLVYPSLYEGFGIPLLEAMNCGCPVACSRRSSFPEVAGDAAEYFDPECIDSIGSAIVRVISSPGLRLELVSRGRRQAALFSWDKCAADTLSIYRSLL